MAPPKKRDDSRWQLQPGEPHEAYRAFRAFCSLPSHRRSPHEAAALCETPWLSRQFAEWSTAWKWRRRVEYYDLHVSATLEGDAAEALEESRDPDHLQRLLARELLRVGMLRIAQLARTPEVLTPREARNFATAGVAAYREVAERGGPNAPSAEQVAAELAEIVESLPGEAFAALREKLSGG